jgi:hypothetical protein
MALSKAVIINLDNDGLHIPVMFNPPSYSLTRSVTHKEKRVPELPGVTLEYVSGAADELSTEFFFDTTDSGTDVRWRTNPIENLTLPLAKTKTPPQLMLVWGSLAFKCYVVSVRAEFDYFSSEGVPLRAKLQVQFKGEDAAYAGAGSGAPDSVEVAPGQALSDIAAQRYQDPGQWRVVAEANDIDDPRRIPAGTRVNLPERP